jgi:hypothetical protein
LNSLPGHFQLLGAPVFRDDPHDRSGALPLLKRPNCRALATLSRNIDEPLERLGGRVRSAGYL